MNKCKVILSLPQGKGNVKINKSEIEDQWKIYADSAKQKCIKILTEANSNQNQDKFELLASILNLKDNLYNQLFTGVCYRKMVIWRDLEIKLAEWGEEKEVEC